MYKLNKIGPRTDPCGTPKSTCWKVLFCIVGRNKIAKDGGAEEGFPHNEGIYQVSKQKESSLNINNSRYVQLR